MKLFSKICKLGFNFCFGQLHGVPILAVSEVLLGFQSLDLKTNKKFKKMKKKKKKLLCNILKYFVSYRFPFCVVLLILGLKSIPHISTFQEIQALYIHTYYSLLELQLYEKSLCKATMKLFSARCIHVFSFFFFMRTKTYQI